MGSFGALEVWGQLGKLELRFGSRGSGSGLKGVEGTAAPHFMCFEPRRARPGSPSRDRSSNSEYLSQ